MFVVFSINQTEICLHLHIILYLYNVKFIIEIVINVNIFYLIIIWKKNLFFLIRIDRIYVSEILGIRYPKIQIQ